MLEPENEKPTPPTLLEQLEQRIEMLNKAWRLFEYFEGSANPLGMKLADKRIMAHAAWLEEHGLSDITDLECDPDRMQFSLPDWLREEIMLKW